MRIPRPLILGVFIVCAFADPPDAALAGDFTAGALRIEAPWVRATPPRAPVAGGYMTITNKGSEADRLLAASVDFADRADVHEMSLSEGVMKMRALPQGLEIKPGQSITLAPSGYHLMFMGLKRQLKPGEKAAGTLTFEKAGAIPVEFTIESIGAQKPAEPTHQH